MIRVGCAGWRLPKEVQPEFPGEGTHLQRYARQFNACEINTSFYRSHRPSLYAKWAREGGPGCLFAVKVPRTLTHSARLRRTEGLDAFLEEIHGLGDGLGPLLLQLPPSLRLEPENVEAFLGTLRAAFDGPVVCEPRHESWFTDEGEALLQRFRVARVAAHPPVAEEADVPGGAGELAYYRLHGSPRRFESEYEAPFLRSLAARLEQITCPTWCIFNNTATPAGLRNALALRDLLHGAGAPPSSE